MSFWRFVSSSLRFHWRINLAVALGVAAATAVLTGALLVGDSVRGSLQALMLDGLGRIDAALVTDRFFRSELAAELESHPGFQKHFASATPAILFPQATVETVGGETTQVAGGVTAIGCDEAFWKLGPPAGPVPTRMPEEGEAILNQPLADEIGVGVGDRVTVRLVKANQVPADSPLGRKSDRTRSLPQLEVIEVLPAEGLGRFSLLPSQHLPRNAYLPLAALQEALDQDGQVNAILAAGRSAAPPSVEEVQQAEQALDAALRPTLADYGFSLKRVTRTFRPGEDAAPETIFDYYNFTTDRMIFSFEAAAVAHKAFAPYNVQPVFTYLANLIQNAAAEQQSEEPGGIPYSTVAALESTEELGPLLDENGRPLRLADDEIVLVDWAARDLNAQAGDIIRLVYFAPETTHGQTEERTASFRLAAIAPLTEPARPYGRRRPAEFDQRPQLTNDPDLTPEVEGVTDQATIDAWDAPFPMTYRVRPEDDDYWSNHRTTPKAYVSLAAGQRLWGSRFGDVTSFRIPASRVLAPEGQSPEEVLEAAFLEQLAQSGEDLGFVFTPVKRRGLEAARGTTSFEGLFLGFSFFIIAAALMLTALLFRLGLERRARELGTLLALGTPRSKSTWLFVAEGAIVAALGGVAGVAAGVGYAWLMLAGLRTLWVEAIVTPFVHLYVTWPSLLIGYVSGAAVSALTIAWTARRMRRVSVRRLLSGQAAEPPSARPRRAIAPWIAAGLLVFAVVLGVLAMQLGGEMQALAFFGGGAAVLGAALAMIRTWLRSGVGAARGYSLPGLAARNASRNPLRSTLTIGLMATASFLIIAISAFRMAPTAEGVGGFELLAESDRPLFADLNDPQQRRDLLGPEASLLDEGTVLALRLKPGEDASCRNIYQTTRPRVIGVTPQLYDHFSRPGVQHFAWADTAAETEEEKANPWLVLRSRGQTPSNGDEAADAVPMILDKNTALYSLHLTGGLGETFIVEYDDGRRIAFRVVGLLSNTILQGSLFIDEERFKQLYPEVSGYNYFLIQTPPGRADETARALEGRLSDFGLDVQDAHAVLTDLLAVQNTYLSTFQSLGALGLLLGVFGLATVQLRSVLERRGELALMRATGFRRSRLAHMVVLENAVLLVGGLATGVLAAAAAVAPHLVIGGAGVPLGQLTWMLAMILAVGLLAGLAAVRAVLHAPLLAALREE